MSNTEPTYPDSMIEWLLSVHARVVAVALGASLDGHPDRWVWMKDSTDTPVDVHAGTADDGYLRAPDGDLLYLGSADDNPTHLVLMGVVEIEGAVAEHIATWDPHAVLRRVNTERAIIEHHARWQRSRRESLEGRTDGEATSYRMAMSWVVEHLAAGWDFMPGYDDSWRPAVLAAV